MGEGEVDEAGLSAESSSDLRALGTDLREGSSSSAAACPLLLPLLLDFPLLLTVLADLRAEPTLFFLLLLLLAALALDDLRRDTGSAAAVASPLLLLALLLTLLALFFLDDDTITTAPHTREQAQRKETRESGWKQAHTTDANSTQTN